MRARPLRTARAANAANAANAHHARTRRTEREHTDSARVAFVDSGLSARMDGRAHHFRPEDAQSRRMDGVIQSAAGAVTGAAKHGRPVL